MIISGCSADSYFFQADKAVPSFLLLTSFTLQLEIPRQLHNELSAGPSDTAVQACCLV